VLLSPYSSRQ